MGILRLVNFLCSLLCCLSYVRLSVHRWDLVFISVTAYGYAHGPAMPIFLTECFRYWSNWVYFSILILILGWSASSLLHLATMRLCFVHLFDLDYLSYQIAFFSVRIFTSNFNQCLNYWSSGREVL